mgnify:CR=1 FL=1
MQDWLVVSLPSDTLTSVSREPGYPGSAVGVCVRSGSLVPGGSADTWLDAALHAASGYYQEQLFIHGINLVQQRSPEALTGMQLSTRRMLWRTPRVSQLQLQDTALPQQCDVVVDIQGQLPDMWVSPRDVAAPSVLIMLQAKQWRGLQPEGVVATLQAYDAVICPTQRCADVFNATALSIGASLALAPPTLRPIPDLGYAVVEWRLAGRPPPPAPTAEPSAMLEPISDTLAHASSLRSLLGLPPHGFVVAVAWEEPSALVQPLLATLCDALPPGWSVATLGPALDEHARLQGASCGKHLGALPAELLVIAVDVMVLPGTAAPLVPLMAAWRAAVPVLMDDVEVMDEYPGTAQAVPSASSGWRAALQAAVQPGQVQAAVTEAHSTVNELPLIGWRNTLRVLHQARVCKRRGWLVRAPQLVVELEEGGYVQQTGRQPSMLCPDSSVCLVHVAASLPGDGCVPSTSIVGLRLTIEVRSMGRPLRPPLLHFAVPGRAAQTVTHMRDGRVNVVLLSGDASLLPDGVADHVLPATAAQIAHGTVHPGHAIVRVSGGYKVAVLAADWVLEQANRI